jgi:tetratricopeptide (TPR) repeat protein
MLFVRSSILTASPAAEFPFTDNPIVGSNWWTGRLTAIDVAARYLWLAIWPSKLSCDYSYNQIPLAHDSLADWLALAAVFAAGAVTVLLLRRGRAFFFFAGFGFLNFLPASNLFFAIGAIMADRLIYLPSLGLAGCLVLGIWRVARIPKLAVAPPLLLGVIAAGFAVRTWVRNRDWQSELTIAEADVRVSPNSFKLHRLLAASLFDSDSSHSNIDQVITEQEKSAGLLESLPDALSRPEVYQMAGYYYLVKSRQPSARRDPALYQKAIRSLLRSISIDQVGHAGNSRFPSGDPRTCLLLSVAYLEMGNADEALSPARQAMALDPVNPQIYRQLSAVFGAKDRRAEAGTAAAVEEAIHAVDRGEWRTAADLSAEVLDSDHEAYPVAFYLNAMANLKLRNLEAAETSARAAVRLDHGGRNPRVNYILGLALVGRGRFRESAQLLNAYLEAAPAAPDAETVRRQLHEIEQMAKSRP